MPTPSQSSPSPQQPDAPSAATFKDGGRPNAAAQTEALARELSSEAESVAPWFVKAMPAYYFASHSERERTDHLKAIIAGQLLTPEKAGQTISLGSPCGTRATHISPGPALTRQATSAVPSSVLDSGNRALLENITRHLEEVVVTARLYQSRDGKLRLDTLHTGEQEPADPTSEPFKRSVALMVEQGRLSEDVLGEIEDEPARGSALPHATGQSTVEIFAAWLAGATKDYVEKFDPERAERHFRLALNLAGRDEVHAELAPLPLSETARVMVAMTDPPSRGLLLQLVKVLGRAGLAVTRAYADLFACGPSCRPESQRMQAIFSAYVRKLDGSALSPEDPLWRTLREELTRIKWYARHDLERFADTRGWPLRRVMLLQAACEFAHQVLVRQNLYAYTSRHVVDAVLEHAGCAELLVEAFEARFSPDAELRAQAQERFTAVEEAIASLASSRGGAGSPASPASPTSNDEVARTVFTAIRDFFANTLRTNYYLEQLHGLAFRLNPAFLDYGQDNAGETVETPHGVYFFHGPHFLGFHVRFREMARGGVRLVKTRSQDAFEIESNRLFSEVVGLASAQQLKNKDIPEGGSKAVLLLGPQANADIAVRSMIDSLLDLILTHPSGDAASTLPGVVDYLGCQEIIYLGPDEHIEPGHIVHAVARARKRGYAYPSAFMSSKPGAGVNHKEYGVTSEGLVVFAHELLKAHGIDPEVQEFRVKLTGGPRGDVAGNAVRILIRDFGARARIVAMADSRGAAYDPQGLDHGELLRLVEEERSIADFAEARLTGESAYVVRADTPEGAKRRANLHNEVEAELFLPCGGRPETINDANWQAYLKADGSPSAPLIAEGANIFLTPGARDALQAAGCFIVTGASANKTGVICSSYEILGGLVMEEAEFLEHKERFVAEVLDILRIRARDEARLLLREYAACGGCEVLTELSLRASREINAISDALYACLTQDDEDLDIHGPEGTFGAVFRNYCPPVLVEHFADRLTERVPRRHQYALVASALASRIVYAEGLGWLTRLAEVTDSRRVAEAYLAGEAALARLAERIRSGGTPEDEEAARILLASGRKLLTDERLGLR